MIQHIVLFSPKAGLPDEDRQAFARATLTTLRDCRDIGRFTVGRRIDVDPGYQRSFGEDGFEFAAVLEFDDRDALVRYLTSPRHAELGRLFWEMCGRTIVMEVETVDPDQGAAALTGR